MQVSSPPIEPNRNWTRGLTAALVAWSTLLGVLSWGPVGHPALSLLVLVPWGWARRRAQVLAASLAYFLASQLDLLSMPGRFYDLCELGAIVAGLGAWLAWSALGAVVFATIWHRRFPAISLLVGLIAITVPPIGWFVMANPLHAAGWWFPETGLWGVFATFVVACVLGHVGTAVQQRKRVALACLAMVSIVAGASTANTLARASTELTTTPARIVAMDSHFGRFPLSNVAAWQRAEWINRAIATLAQENDQALVVVLPEMVVGVWGPKMEYWLQPTIQATQANGVAVLVGAVMPPNQKHRHPRNGVMVIQDGQTRWHSGRIPMPGDWHPGATGFESSPLNIAVVDVNHRRLALSICYEDTLPWTRLQSVTEHVDAYVSIRSLWWARGLPVGRRMTLMAQGWARLSGVPLVEATNW